MYLSLLTAKNTIDRENMLELRSVLQGIDIVDMDVNMGIEAEDLMDTSGDGVVANEEEAGGMGGGNSAGGRFVRLTHSDRTKLRTGCHARTWVPLEEFKRLVHVVEEAQARIGA